MTKAANIERAISPEAGFSPKKKLLARFIAEGKEIRTAAKLSGYATNGGEVWRTTKDPNFVALVKKLQSKNERMADMSRKRVLDGFLEAIEQAKLMSEPMTQIAGWRELAKMCGYYAPEVKTLNVNVTSQRLLTQLETLSDKDLLEIIEHDAEAIEGEARELLDYVPDSSHASSAPA